MHILLLELDLHIESSQSLKDKRSVVKPIVEHLRGNYNVAVAEVDYQDLWQRAGLAVVTVCTLRDRAQQTIDKVIAEVERHGDADIVGIQTQWL